MTVLAVGASGVTGRLLLEQLLDRGRSVRAIVRSPDKLPEHLKQRGQLSVIAAGVAELSETELAGHVAGCRAVASCLGHNLSLKGIYGHPRRLVTDAVRRLCAAVEASRADAPTRFVLMNSAGVRNRNLREPVSLAQRCVLGLLRGLVPPHADNENAADFLRTEVGPGDGTIEWAVVRPDSLINEDDVTPYEVHASPIRSAIFNSGKTSRINVAHFMAELITDDDTWTAWKGQMPVIYNKPAG